MKKSKKNPPSYAIYNFPYYKKNQSFFRIFLLKALLACITGASGAAYFTFLMRTKNSFTDSITAASVAFTSCAVFYLLLNLFKKRYVVLFAASTALIFGYFHFDAIVFYAKNFWIHVLKISDGVIVSTKAWKYTYVNPVPMIILICILFGIICAISSFRRFHSEPILIITAIMSVPAFLSLTASFSPSLAVYIAGIMGLWSMDLSSAANAYISTGGVYNIHIYDRQYKKNNKKASPAKLFKENSLRYGEYLSDGMVIFTVTVVTMGIIVSVFPKNGAIKFNELIDNTVKIYQNIGNWGYNLFSGLKRPSFEGFFSADGGSINISNGIMPDNNKSNGVKVAEVITQNKDKLYLRGDVGLNFNEKGWSSISSLDFNDIEFEHYNAENYEYTGKVPIQEAFDLYIPEIQYFLAYNSINAIKYEHTKYIWLQTVKVNYIQNMNTVLFPGVPFTYNFRKNTNFTVKGDFIALADKGKINSMEIGVLYPAADPYDCITTASNLYYMDDLYEQLFFYDLPITQETYESYQKDYEKFIYQYFVEVSDKDKTYIKEFTDDTLYGFIQDLDSENNVDRAIIAELIQKRLKSGEYRYSLTTDNFSGEHPPVYTFLNETKSGHCAMYATSMCLALRYMGIPARYVTGFTVGGNNCTAAEGGGYKYELTDKDLHAWVEVYYDDLGWLPYDPTPARTFSEIYESQTSSTTQPPVFITTPSETTPAPTETTATSTSDSTTKASSDSFSGTEGEAPSKPDNNPEIIKIILIVAGCIAAALAIALSISGAFKSLNRREKERLRFFKNGNPTDAVRDMLDFTLKLLAINGIRRRKGETPEEFGARAEESMKTEGIMLNAVSLFERGEFDRDPVFNEDERLIVYECAEKLLKITLENVKQPRRLFIRMHIFRKR